MKVISAFEKKTASNASRTTIQLIKTLKVPVSSSTAIKVLEQHPDYPSLLSISDSLKQWKIDNLAMEIDNSKLGELPTPFIAHTKTGEGNFLLVTDVNGQVSFFDDQGKKQQRSRQEFEKQWDGRVLLAEASPEAGEENYRTERRKEILESLRLPIILVSSLALTAAFCIEIASTHIWSSLLLPIKFLGCVVAGLLLWFDIDKSGSLVKQICALGGKTDCTKVLKSKQSKLLSWLSWSEAGFFYFAGGFVFLLVTASTAPLAFNLLCFLNLITLPYVIFSLYYQWRVAKQWCLLCMAVQVLLMAEGTVSLLSPWIPGLSGINLTNSGIIQLLTSFAIPILFWIATKKVYRTAHSARWFETQTNKFKHNRQVFKALLQSENSISLPDPNLGIILGKPDATNTIIKVCNPYCGPCAEMHPLIHDLLIKSENLKLQIIFAVTDREDDPAGLPVKHFLTLYETADADKLTEALDNWYNSKEKNYEAFAHKYPLETGLVNHGDKLKSMSDWCTAENISFTPAVFINGYPLPDLYKVSDLNYLL